MIKPSSENQKISAVIQARMSSSRLAGKMLLPLAGKPAILRMLERVERAYLIDEIVVATSIDGSDDPLATVVESSGHTVFRGPLDDVLARFHGAARNHPHDHIIRLTGDCPLIDWTYIDALADFHVAGAYDYSSNAISPTLPDGMDAEIMTFAALNKAYEKAAKPSEREHVTPYIYRPDSEFRIGRWRHDKDLSHLRLTLDEAEDYELISAIYDALYPRKPDFSLADILEFFTTHPDLIDLNKNIKRNEGYARSIAQDKSS